MRQKITGGAGPGSSLAPVNGSSGTVAASAWCSALWEELACGRWPDSIQGVKSYFALFPTSSVSCLFFFSFFQPFSAFCPGPCIHHLCLFPHLAQLFVSLALFSTSSPLSLPGYCPSSSFAAYSSFPIPSFALSARRFIFLLIGVLVSERSGRGGEPPDDRKGRNKYKFICATFKSASSKISLLPPQQSDVLPPAYFIVFQAQGSPFTFTVNLH